MGIIFLFTKCTLYDRECVDCGECDACDLDSSKICDSCGKCLNEEEEYRSIDVKEFLNKQENKNNNKKAEKD
jgi:hypothetical protein